MAIDYDKALLVAQSVADMYRSAEYRLTRLVTRQLATGLDQPSDWATRKLLEVVQLRRAAQLVADQITLAGTIAVRRAVADGYRAGHANAPVDLAERLVGATHPAARAARQPMGSAIQALADAAVKELRPVHEAILPQTITAYRRAVTAATARTLTGSQDLRRAAQAAWASIADQGIVYFTDKVGRRWQLSSYVEMATRTAVARAAIIGQRDAWDAAGVSDCYVVDRPRECPKCRPFEGKILSLREPRSKHAVATLAEAMQAGLFHPNCRHQLRPWAPGTVIGKPILPEGQAGYDAEQRQRAIERGLRGWRTRQAAAFTDEARVAADLKVAEWEQALVQHLQAHPLLARKAYREQPGAGFTPSEARRSDTAD